MKILKLRLAGFGPYKDEQLVDFEAFDDDGIFLITGKTGAGKSSILDAICYALFNGIPRYEGSQQKLRSDHCESKDPTFVELDFEVDGVVYRVRRSPLYERPKQHGIGTTTTAATAELSRRIGEARAGETWEGMSARLVDVGKDIVELVGLTKDQFLQVILLAQNRFQQFLGSNSDERQTVLRKLFGTERFLGYETLLVERRKALETEVAAALGSLSGLAADLARLCRVDQDRADDDGSDDHGLGDDRLGDNRMAGRQNLDWFEACRAGLESERVRAEVDWKKADVALSTADSEHRRLVSIRTQQLRRDRAAAMLETLLASADEIAADRATHETSVRAARVWPHVTARRVAQVALDAAQIIESEARSAYSRFGPADLAHAALGSVIDSVTRQLGSLDDALGDEIRLKGLEAETSGAEAVHLSRTTAVTAAVERLDRLPGAIDVQTEKLGAMRVEAATGTNARETVERLRAAATAAARATELERKLAEAFDRELSATRANATAAARLHDLMTQRLAGHASELAADLLEGEPCAVCGSPDHPAPATSEAELVTQEIVDAARVSLDERHEEAKSAAAEREILSVQHADAAGRAEGRALAEIEAQLVVAWTALARSESALEQCAEIEFTIAELRRELTEAQLGLDKLQHARDAASARVTEARSIRDSTAERVHKQREGFDTVAERAAALHRQLSAARELNAAIDESSATERTLAQAVAALAVQLEEHDFEHENAVAVARLEDDESALVESRVGVHETGVATARATVNEPELSELPQQLVELDDASDLLALVKGERDETIGALSALRERALESTRIVAVARRQFAASEALQVEYEQLHELANAVQGKDPNTRRMRLETYVLAARLEQIVAAANVRLRVMTSGRFSLEHDDSLQYRNTASGLGLSILDEHTGRSRATHSLSGGETFLASLALALGLAEVVTNQAGGIRLDTLFIDEGFGSLDNGTLEVAMSTLDGLRAGGRTIGLISHVGSMKEQIGGKLAVNVLPQGYSEIGLAMSIGD